jgi:hypothetical protein
MTDISTAHHDAGHALLAFLNDIGPRSVSIEATERHAGIAKLSPHTGLDDITCAAVLIAGELAEQKAVGRTLRFNWLRDDGPNSDASKARWYTDRLPEPLFARRAAGVKAYDRTRMVRSTLRPSASSTAVRWN